MPFASIYTYLKTNFQLKNLIILCFITLVASLIPHAINYTQTLGYDLSLTGSLPIGFWKKNTEGIGSHYVAFCLQKKEYAFFYHQYMNNNSAEKHRCPYEMPVFIKPVMARTGDHIKLTNASVIVNQIPLANTPTLLKTPTTKLDVPHIARGEYTVEPDTLWVFSTYNKASFDSRYYGAIPIKSVLYGVRPAFVYIDNFEYKLISSSPLTCLWRFCWATSSKY